MSEVRMSLEPVVQNLGRWEARIKLPDDLVESTVDVSVGTWGDETGHGILVSAKDYRDLQAIGFLLENAAERAKRLVARASQEFLEGAKEADEALASGNTRPMSEVVREMEIEEESK